VVERFTYSLLNDTSLEEWQEPVDLQESEMNDHGDELASGFVAQPGGRP
jgi:hypothetical protein